MVNKIKLGKISKLFLALVFIINSSIYPLTVFSASGSGSIPQVLNLTETSDIPTLDTSAATDSVSFNVLGNVMEGLYTLDKNGQAVPGVAASLPSVSSDGKTYTITLRDAKWSNGEKITAADFVYAWQRAVDPATRSEYAYNLYPVLNAKAVSYGDLPVSDLGVRAIDEKNLEIKLHTKIPYFETLLSFPTYYPLQQKFVESQGSSYGTDFDKVLYNGPFMLESWTKNVGWVYVKNPSYWDASSVTLSKINVKIVKDGNTLAALYNSGAVDRIGIAGSLVPTYKNQVGFGQKKDTSLYFLRLNQTNPVLANVDARKAISKAFDKTVLCDVLLKNGSIPANYLVPSEFLKDKNGKDFREAYGDMNTYNVKVAQDHWAAAKATLGVENVTLSLLNYDSDSAMMIGEFLKEELEKNLPGLTIENNPFPFAQKLDLESKMDYDLSYAGWGPDYLDPMTFLDMFVTDGGYNQMGYSNQAYDDIISNANSLDEDKRWSEFQRAEKILIADDQAIAPLYQKAVTFVQNPKVVGLQTNSFGPDFYYKNVKIVESANTPVVQIDAENPVVTLNEDLGKVVFTSEEVVPDSNLPRYTWTFEDIEVEGNATSVAVDLTISSLPTNVESQVKKEIEKHSKNAMFVHFNYHGKLPGKATIKYYVGGQYKVGDKLDFFYYNSESKRIETVQKSLVVDANGFVSFTIDHCSDYFLAPATLPKTGESRNSLYMLFGVIMVLPTSIVVERRRNKKFN